MAPVPTRRAILGWCDTLSRETELQGQVHQLQRIIIEIRQRGCEAVVDEVLADHGLRIPAVYLQRAPDQARVLRGWPPSIFGVYLPERGVYLMAATKGGKPSRGTPADGRLRGRGKKPGPKPKRSSKR